jgi:tRNA pseudouridine55 synthase
VTDLGEKLGTLAHVTSLRRLSVGTYAESQMVDLAALEGMADQGLEVLDRHLLGVDTALTALPAVSLDSARATSLKLGQRVAADTEMPVGEVRIYGPDHSFVGIGEVLVSGELRPKKIFGLQELGQS